MKITTRADHVFIAQFNFRSIVILITLGARDFSNAVSGRGFGLRPKTCRPSANTENSRRKREKPLVPRVDSDVLANLTYEEGAGKTRQSMSDEENMCNRNHI